MKPTKAIFVVILMVMSGCGRNRQGNESDGFITVDITKNYPKKEMILQNFMDVEYIPLETSGDFYTQGIVLDIGMEYLLIKNRINDGNIYVFDRKGKGLRIINRQGKGPEEYLNNSRTILDEDKSELFVSNVNRIIVYDLFGNFKRSLPFEENARYSEIYIFDSESLICKDSSFDNNEVTNKPQFVIISKQDGSIIKRIQISCQQKLANQKQIPHAELTLVVYVSNFPDTPLISYHDSWILTVYSNDTIFRYLPDDNMIPFMIRTPSIQSNNPKANLSLGTLTEHYYFLQAEKIEPEVKGTTPMDSRVFFPRTYLVYDKQERKIYEYLVYNDDFSNKITVNMSQNNVNNEIAFSQKLEANELFDAHKKGELKGKLEEIAAELEEESNPVIMLVKYKR